MSNPWFEYFERAGAIWRWPGLGFHAAYLLSDHHADFYFNTDVIANAPTHRDHVVTRGLAASIAARPDVIVSPKLSIRAAATLGEALARHWAVPFAAFDPAAQRWGADLPTHGRAVVCTDDIHGGGSARQVVRAARHSGLNVEGVVTIANFSGRRKIEGAPVFSLITHEFGVWSSAQCPLCRAGSPAIDPRGRWADLARGASDTK